jgi:hypothetical protein
MLALAVTSFRDYEGKDHVELHCPGSLSGELSIRVHLYPSLGLSLHCGVPLETPQMWHHGPLVLWFETSKSIFCQGHELSSLCSAAHACNPKFWMVLPFQRASVSSDILKALESPALFISTHFSWAFQTKEPLW